MKTACTWHISLLAFVCMLTPELIAHPIDSTERSSGTTGWSVCVPFEKVAGGQRKITRGDYEMVVAAFKQLAKTPLPPAQAEVISLSVMNAAVISH